MTEQAQEVQNPLAAILKRPRADQMIDAINNVPLVLPDADTAANVGQLIKMIRNEVQQLEEKRKSCTELMLEAKKLVDADYKEKTVPYNAALDELNKRLTAFMDEKERKAKEEQARLQKEQDDRALEKAAALEEGGDSEAAAEVVEEAADAGAPGVVVPKTLHGAYGSTTVMQDNWKCEVEDISKLPVEYLLPNTAMLNKAVRSDGVREILGCKIWNDRKAVTR